jgi:hypothetical protein
MLVLKVVGSHKFDNSFFLKSIFTMLKTKLIKSIATPTSSSIKVLKKVEIQVLFLVSWIWQNKCIF